MKGSCIGVPGNDCGGKLVGDMLGGVDRYRMSKLELSLPREREGSIHGLG